MPTHLASLDPLVHPHQIEVQEFASYALVIDARSAGAYQEDYLPGAVSVPVAGVPPRPDRTHLVGHHGAVRIGQSNISNLALTGRSTVRSSRQHPTPSSHSSPWWFNSRFWS